MIEGPGRHRITLDFYADLAPDVARIAGERLIALADKYEPLRRSV